jgi:hypothetical protein
MLTPIPRALGQKPVGRRDLGPGPARPPRPPPGDLFLPPSPPRSLLTAPLPPEGELWSDRLAARARATFATRPGGLPGAAMVGRPLLGTDCLQRSPGQPFFAGASFCSAEKRAANSAAVEHWLQGARGSSLAEAWARRPRISWIDTTPQMAATQKELRCALGELSQTCHQVLPSMPDRDVRRATENAWPMLCLQLLDGQPARITESMVGFSLLYPLTDDVIDDPKVLKDEKKDFLQRFAGLISRGGSAARDTVNERAVWEMFGKIEGEWDRGEHPIKYRLMGELLQAQVDSQAQLAGPHHGDKPVPDFDRVWEITVRKGALSVLCDAALVKEALTDAEASFAAHLGSITQFLNDLRTVDEDLAEGQYTPFNLLHARGEKLDGVLDALSRYFVETFTGPDARELIGRSPRKAELMTAMLASLGQQLIEGIALNREKISPGYLAHVEQLAPLPLTLIEAQARLRKALEVRA